MPVVFLLYVLSWLQDPSQDKHTAFSYVFLVSSNLWQFISCLAFHDFESFEEFWSGIL